MPAGTYTLTMGQLEVMQSLTIQGAGAATTFIDVDARHTSRVFHTSGAGGRVALACTGQGCPFTRRMPASHRRALDLTGMFKHSRLAPGAAVEVVITAANRVGEVVRFTMLAGVRPRADLLCLPPGERRPVACRPGS